MRADMGVADGSWVALGLPAPLSPGEADTEPLQWAAELGHEIGAPIPRSELSCQGKLKGPKVLVRIRLKSIKSQCLHFCFWKHHK